MNAKLNLSHIQDRIKQACEQAGREASEVALLAVSKTFPAEAVLEFVEAGHRSFGENYLQEAVDKITHLAESPNCPPLTWHFIGPIQSNKTKPVAEHFDWVHSVDRLKIAQRLSSQRPSNMAPLNVLIQVNTSGEESKSGIAPAEVLPLAKEISKLPGLALRGLMTIPSNTNESCKLKEEFLCCKSLLEALQAEGIKGLDTLSMGMSSDLELAIACGSTCVRVGTALFGQRDYSNQP